MSRGARAEVGLPLDAGLPIISSVVMTVLLTSVPPKLGGGRAALGRPLCAGRAFPRPSQGGIAASRAGAGPSFRTMAPGGRRRRALGLLAVWSCRRAAGVQEEALVEDARACAPQAAGGRMSLGSAGVGSAQMPLEMRSKHASGDARRPATGLAREQPAVRSESRLGFRSGMGDRRSELGWESTPRSGSGLAASASPRVPAPVAPLCRPNPSLERAVWSQTPWLRTSGRSWATPPATLSG